jgi:hypothetical protein
MPTIKVAVINASTVLKNAEVSVAVPTLQTQVHRDFAPAWGVDASLVFVPKGATPPPGAWWLTILDNSDQAGALGYHDLTNQGLPLGKVFAGTDMQYGNSWTVTASHELLEMLGDPDINLAAYVEHPKGGMRLYAYEVCDACEADKFAYRIDGTLVSDFVYPAWFEAFRRPGSARFDHRGAIKGPFKLLPGGYIGIFDCPAGGGWTQITADRRSLRYHARAPVGSRRERRRTPREQWQKSDIKRSRLNRKPR